MSAWTTLREDGRPVGLTVSSMLIADGAPGQVVGIVDPDSDVGEALVVGSRLAVTVLGPESQLLAETLAGLAPAPGGAFARFAWTETRWGPVFDDRAGWLGATVVSIIEDVGWFHLVRGRIDHLELGTAEGLGTYRGMWLRP